MNCLPTEVESYIWRLYYTDYYTNNILDKIACCRRLKACRSIIVTCKTNTALTQHLQSLFEYSQEMAYHNTERNWEVDWYFTMSKFNEISSSKGTVLSLFDSDISDDDIDCILSEVVSCLEAESCSVIPLYCNCLTCNKFKRNKVTCSLGVASMLS